MAKKLDSIVELAAQKTREISANSGNYMAFLTTAAHNFKYNFRDQLLIYAQKPDATACAQIDFWNKHGRYVNRGTRGIALLVDTDQGYKLVLLPAFWKRRRSSWRTTLATTSRSCGASKRAAC